MKRISGETASLYSDLRDRLFVMESIRSVAHLPGDFVSKEVKGRRYHYFQATLPVSRAQIYIGPDSPDVRQLIADRKTGRQDAQDDELFIRRLSAQLIAGGIPPIHSDMARVIERLAHSGVFHGGAVLVGGIAFQILGTHMGILWDTEVRMTQDIDIASEDGRVDVGVLETGSNVPSTIESLKMGFFPVPRLSHKEPSTSFAIRGKTLRIDLLTPLQGEKTTPVFISRLGAAAQPLKYLDYLIESPIHAAMVAGTPCLVKVPQPARFALHKLLISRERGSSSDKARKDVAQAKAMIEIIKEEFPSDLATAKADFVRRGSSWAKKLSSAIHQTHLDF